jgi:predicted membrane channel-forming protein YqfA (hemolysin III family)
MRSSWLFGALVCFIIGVVLTISIIGAIIGIPLIILSVILLILGIIIPGKKKEIHHIHHHKK